jgi:hypothetical protein
VRAFQALGTALHATPRAVNWMCYLFPILADAGPRLELFKPARRWTRLMWQHRAHHLSSLWVVGRLW